MVTTAITIDKLTEATIAGTGAFDVLMRANKVHLEQEFTKGRIKGPEYATVYLGSMQAMVQAALAFLSQNQKVAAEIALLEAQTDLVTQQALNAVKEGAVLDAQKCKLDAEFDLIKSQTLKSAGEIALLAQKTATEKAQTTALGVDEDSVIGKQKALYGAQKEGFTRDAEQKAADLMVKTWMARRTTDEGTVFDSVNMLNDAAIGRAVNKLLSGVGA